MSKKLREQVYAKYGGRCAYCGAEITMRQMQVDHIIPIRRGMMQTPEMKERLSCIGNLNPACRSCNNWKLVFSVEEFRRELAAQVERLRLRSANFRIAERYGLVGATETPVVFWFEKVMP